MPELKPASELSLDHESMGLEARVSKADHQSLRLWLRLLSSSTEIEAEIRRRMRSQFDMALAHFDYLAQLYRYPDGLSMRLLSRYLMVTGGNVTGLTDDMENEGFVSRAMSPGDRRSYTVKLTRQGRKMFEQVASVHETWVVELFAGHALAVRHPAVDKPLHRGFGLGLGTLGHAHRIGHQFRHVIEQLVTRLHHILLSVDANMIRQGPAFKAPPR